LRPAIWENGDGHFAVLDLHAAACRLCHCGEPHELWLGDDGFLGHGFPSWQGEKVTGCARGAATYQSLRPLSSGPWAGASGTTIGETTMLPSGSSRIVTFFSRAISAALRTIASDQRR